MFKKICFFNISASLLLSIPLTAVTPEHHGHHHNNHHHHDHHHEKEKEKLKEIAEEKAKEKSIAAKLAAGALQFVNKTPAFCAFILSCGIGYFGPICLNPSRGEELIAKFIEGGVSFLVLWPTLKYGTAAAMAQENIKPLNK
jgi:hypothetical protein